MAEQELWTSADVARQAGVMPDTIRYWARAGILRPAVITPGGQRLFRPSEVARVIAQRQREPVPGGYEVDQIELQLQITAEGSVGIIASGKAGMTGGISVVLKCPPSSPPKP